jgi:diadenosine tetraphosphate (Ap4A) HIT family hydrolase
MITRSPVLLEKHQGGISVICDESGICDLVDIIRADPAHVGRLLRSDELSGVVVDLSPVTPGHLLVLPYAHETALAQADRDRFLALGKMVEWATKRLHRLGYPHVVAVEHGSPRHPMPGSCVLHTHVHVCPVGSRMDRAREAMAAVSDLILGAVVIPSWLDAYKDLKDRDGYVLLKTRHEIVVGDPAPGVRQISRVLLHRLNSLPGLDIDWVVRAEGATYTETLRRLGLDGKAVR